MTNEPKDDLIEKTAEEVSSGPAEEPASPEEPWVRLRELTDAGDPAALAEYLDSLPPGEAQRAVARLDPEDRERLFRTLAPEDAAELLERLSEAQAGDLIEELDPAEAAKILDHVHSDEQADILQEVDPERAEEIIEEMEAEEAADVRLLRSYPRDTAGGLMIREYLAYPASWTVGQVLADMEANADRYWDYDVQYTYVIDEFGRLIGVLRAQDLLLAPRFKRLGELMLPSPRSVRDTSSLEELEAFFDSHPYQAVPVVDAGGVLLGVVRRADLEEEIGHRADDEYRKSQGIVGGEELRSMPTLLRARRRLSWLSVNILLNLISASVIALYQDTLAQVIALAVFLPIISDMSGCSGNQAVAVSMRELTLGVARPRDVLYVLGRELAVGVINGVALGVLIALVAWLWKGNPYLGAVVGGALAVNTIVSVSLGGTIPLILKRLGLDPALASGPVLTTVTDLCGFFFALSFASFALPWLRS